MIMDADMAMKLQVKVTEGSTMSLNGSHKTM